MKTFVATFSLFCSVAIAYAGPIENDVDPAKVNPEWCARGQIVWCKNFTSAAQCDAVNHCIQTVWLNTKPVGNGDSCTDCVRSLDNIRKNLDSNTTKEVLRDALDAVCELNFITAAFHKLCERFIETYVDKYFNELLDLLESSVDSRTICSILFFCDTLSSASADVIQDDAVIHYENIVLHLPARYIDLEEVPKLLGNEKCTWGPTYWCGSIPSSKECKMTSHCIENVWSKTPYHEDNDSVCQICKDMVKQARDQLQSNETQEELKEVFEGSCKLIPIKEIRVECIKLADEFVPELTEMIVEQLNPTAICTVAGLCNSRRIDNLLADASSASAAASPLAFDSCTNCTIAFTAVDRFLQNSPRDDVLDKLLRLCGLLSSYSDPCTAFVIDHFENLYATMKSRLQPWAACHVTGMCAHKYHFHESMEQSQVDTALATVDDDFSCDLCKELITDVKNVLVKNTTEEEFLQVLEGFCRQLGQFKAECLQLVDENFKLIYKFLAEELNASEVCRELNICPNGNAITDDSFNLIGSGRIVPRISASAQITSLNAAKTMSSSDDVECGFCKTIVRMIEGELKDPKVEHDIEKAVEEVCKLTPSADKAKCDKFVETYADVLINLLADETDPEVVCSMMQLCAKMTYELCPLCRSITNFLEQELNDPKVDRSIEEAVDNVCKLAPSSQVADCERFINQYSSLIISILATEMDPKLVCPFLNMCPPSLSARDRCDGCQILINDLVDQLKGNRRETNIKRRLETFVPTVRDDTRLVALELKFRHYEDIIDMMTAEFDGEESCTYLRFCDPHTVTPVAARRKDKITDNGIVAASASRTDVKSPCEMCELLVRMYEDKLASAVTEHDVEIDFLKYCDEIRDPESKLNCSRLIDGSLPLLMSLLKRDVKPKDLCGLAKLCPLRASNSFSLESMRECRVCEVVVGALQSVSEDPYVKDETTSEMAKVCELVGKEEENTCTAIVNALVPQIETVISEIPSWYYCAKLDMCPYREHLIDPYVCSKPESWCEDLKTAVICDKLEHCRRTVWMAERPNEL